MDYLIKTKQDQNRGCCFCGDGNINEDWIL